jgi:hypothetical protein
MTKVLDLWRCVCTSHSLSAKFNILDLWNYFASAGIPRWSCPWFVRKHLSEAGCEIGLSSLFETGLGSDSLVCARPSYVRSI